MHPKVESRARRVHGAEIKSKVLAECRAPGASVSAVAMAHGLNANLVRTWMRGRGVQRAGLKADTGPEARIALASAPTPAAGAAKLQFVPVELAASSKSIDEAAAPWRPGVSQSVQAAIEVELRCGNGHVTVRWPTTQAARCAVWLRELGAAVLQVSSRP